MKRRTFIRQGTTGLLAGTVGSVAVSYAGKGPDAKLEPAILSTPLCQLLNIRYPIFQAGMADVAGPELVAAVSNAGGLGILTATMVPPDVLKERIGKIRELTDKPFGVNLILHQDLFPPAEFEIHDATVEAVQGTLNGFRRELGIPESEVKPSKLPPLIQLAFEVILAEKVPVFSVGLGNPSAAMVEACHENDMKVLAMVSTLEDALAVEGNGVDVLVAQGSEAGGHRSTWEKKPSHEYAAIGTLPLTSALVGRARTPVIAAGGIVNGKGLKAALAIGAQGVMMGTRFIATKESMAPESYKQRILEGSSDHTTTTDVFTGMYARVLRNTFTETYQGSQAPVLPPGRQYAATVDIVRAAGKQDRADYYSLYAGQGIDEVNEILPAGEVVARVIGEAMN